MFREAESPRLRPKIVLAGSGDTCLFAGVHAAADGLKKTDKAIVGRSTYSKIVASFQHVIDGQADMKSLTIRVVMAAVVRLLVEFMFEGATSKMVLMRAAPSCAGLVLGFLLERHRFLLGHCTDMKTPRRPSPSFWLRNIVHKRVFEHSFQTCVSLILDESTM